MFAPFVEARLGAAARLATTAILALLLLVAGFTPARALPTLAAAGLSQAGGGFVQLGTADHAWGLRPTTHDAGAPQASFDAAAPGHHGIALAAGRGLASPGHAPAAASRPRARFRPRAPPTTV